ncbi:MAG: hypothetical protein LAO03_16825 [Acidobacteriia bacterium]|nr:hypothetical protein [Terriglobia bacterium]
MRQVKLPAALCESIEQRFGKHSDGLEQFLTFVMEELLRDNAAQMDEAEKRLIEQRLKDLGYI